MSISFDTAACSGLMPVFDPIVDRPVRLNKDGLPWYQKRCPSCSSIHGAAKKFCSCGHQFKPYTAKKKIEVKKRIVRSAKPSEMIAVASNSTIAVPTAKLPASTKSKIMRLQARISDYLGLIAAAQREISELVLSD
jgi:hypothetical protein